MQPHHLVLANLIFFNFHHTTTTNIYTLSLHDALPISLQKTAGMHRFIWNLTWASSGGPIADEEAEFRNPSGPRSEEHTSELQSRGHLVCRLLLEKKKISSSASL